jgi:hypothetical protein
VLLDFFNPQGLGNSLPSHSPSSDTCCLADTRTRSCDLGHHAKLRVIEGVTYGGIESDSESLLRPGVDQAQIK